LVNTVRYLVRNYFEKFRKKKDYFFVDTPILDIERGMGKRDVQKQLNANKIFRKLDM
jgi:hypothetical protein